jgi:hypothetical protein
MDDRESVKMRPGLEFWTAVYKWMEERYPRDRYDQHYTEMMELAYELGYKAGKNDA